MAQLPEFRVDGEITVLLRHAVEQARERFGGEYVADTDAVRDLIAREIRESVDRGMTFDVKIAPWQRFIRHPGGERGWVIALDGGAVTVVTSLSRLTKVARP